MSVSDNSYWESYLQASQKLFDTGLHGIAQQSTTGQPYADALSGWWSKVSPDSPPATKQLFEKLIEQGAAYFQFVEHLNSNGGSTDKDASENWASSALNILSELERSFSQSGSQQVPSTSQVEKLLEQPFAAWEVFANSLGNNTPGLQTILTNLASSPALGINREHQSLLQQYLEKELEYQQVLVEYQQFHKNVGIKSCERLKQALPQSDGDQEKPFRTIYNLWVAECEGVYAEEVATDFFSTLYGKLVNAMMSLHQARQKLVDKSLAGLGLPTQQHNQDLSQSLQGLRRQQKHYQKDIHQLQLRCDQLEKIVAKSAGQTTDAATPSTPAKTKSRQTKTRSVKTGNRKKSSNRTRSKNNG